VRAEPQKPVFGTSDDLGIYVLNMVACIQECRLRFDVLDASDLCCVDPVIVLRSRHKAHVCGINSTESILLPSSASITPWKTAAGAIETCIILRIQCM